MHGSMHVRKPIEQFQEQAAACIKRAGEAANPEDQRLWLNLARECQRLAEPVPIFGEADPPRAETDGTRHGADKSALDTAEAG